MSFNVLGNAVWVIAATQSTADFDPVESILVIVIAIGFGVLFYKGQKRERHRLDNTTKKCGTCRMDIPKGHVDALTAGQSRVTGFDYNDQKEVEAN